MKRTCLGVAVALALSLVWLTPGAFAEPYIAGYGGIALSDNTDLETDVSLAGDPEIGDSGFVEVPVIRGAVFGTNVDKSAVFGGKIGYWFDFFPFIGAELDMYVFNPDITVPAGQISNNVTLNAPFEFDVLVVAIGLNIMGRLHVFKSPKFPRGRLQPVIGIGPSLFITTIDDQEPIADNSLGKKTLAFGGFQGIVGLKFFILKNLALFAEYKFTFFTADLSGVSENFSLGGTMDIQTHHFYGGVAFHFY